MKEIALILQEMFVAAAKRFRLAAAILALLCADSTLAFSDAELIDGFKRTVFGSEYPGWGRQSKIVKKFVAPVRVYVDDRSSARRGGEVRRFARSLPRLIRGLELTTVGSAAEANFRILVIDRADYRATVAREVYGRPSSTFAPGKCLVRVVSTDSGISRSDAVIVADEGEFLFRRCLVEETLQGLGPVNDSRALPESVFNDRSPHATFTRFDQRLLNMLYDPRVRPGMTKSEVAGILPAVAADVQRR
jgi:hypothetical protein